MLFPSLDYYFYTYDVRWCVLLSVGPSWWCAFVSISIFCLLSHSGRRARKKRTHNIRFQHDWVINFIQHNVFQMSPPIEWNGKKINTHMRHWLQCACVRLVLWYFFTLRGVDMIPNLSLSTFFPSKYSFGSFLYEIWVVNKQTRKN